MDRQIGLEMSFIVVEAIRGRCASFMILTAEIFDGQTNSSILVVLYCIVLLQELGLSNSCYCLKDQRKLNPDFSTSLRTYTFDDVGVLVKKMRDDWEMLSLTDLVLNHTANESEWLLKHPDSAYNVCNTPHLRPAYLVDRILWHLTIDVAAGRYAGIGLPPEINNEQHVSVSQSRAYHLVERGSSAVECRTRNRESPASLYK